MKNVMFCILLLSALLIPTLAFASTDDTSSNISDNQVTFQSIVGQVLSFFCGTTSTSGFISGSDNNGSYVNNSGSNYSEDDCNYQQSSPYESDEIWKRWYCVGGEWGSF